MPSKNIGEKKIKKVSKFKNKVNVVLVNNEKLTMDVDTYSSFYLYENKVLSNREYKKLKERIAISSSLSDLKKVLSKKRLSEWKAREYLYNKKQLNKIQVDEIIKILKNQHLIDDKLLSNDYVSYLNDKGFGKEKILNTLHNKGIFDEITSKITFSQTKENKKAKDLVLKLNDKYKLLTYQNKKEKIYAYLLRQGFNHESIDHALKFVSEPKRSVEISQLKKDYLKLKTRYQSNDEQIESLNDKIFIKLKQKGYKTDDIKLVMEDKE